MTEVEFIKQLVPSFYNITNNDDYLKSRFNIYKNYMDRAEVPASYIPTIMPNPIADLYVYKKEISGFVERIKDFLDCEFNCIFNFETYTGVDKIAFYIIQRYLSDYLASNDPIKNILYIDAVTFMRDMKLNIGNNTTETMRPPSYRQETLNGGVENADFVIWDKLTYLQTNYERGELYNILSIRHKKGLGNLFFTIKGKQHISDVLGEAICSLLSGCSLINMK